MVTEERQKDLESAILQIERQFGKGAIMKMDGSSVGQYPAAYLEVELLKFMDQKLPVKPH